MLRTCLPWGSSQERMNNRRKVSSQQQMGGSVPVGLWEIKGNSVPNVGSRNQWETISGPAPVGLKIKGNSAPSAESQSQQEFLSISVINAVGNQKIRRNHPSSALSAEIRLIMET